MKTDFSGVYKGFAIVILFASFYCVLSLFSPSIWPFSTPNISDNKYNIAVLIGVFVSIANAMLLWLTLEKQKEAIEDQRKIFNQQSFENTFFKLLDSHRRLVKDLSIPSQGDYCKGIKCFEYACNQINLISESLKSNRYYDDEDGLKDEYESRCHDEQEYGDDESYLAELHSEYLLKCSMFKVNRYYGILKDVWTQNKDLKPDEIRKNAVKIFFNRYQAVFEHYFRSLDMLRKYAEESNNFAKYKEIIFVHMPQIELGFAKLYYDNFKSKEEVK